jgi:hypothetical protein
MEKTELQELFPGEIKVTLTGSDIDCAVHELRIEDLDAAIEFLTPYQQALDTAMTLAKDQGVDINTVSNVQVLYDAIIKHRVEAMSFCSAVSNVSADKLKKLTLTQLMILLGAGVQANAGFFLNVIVRMGVGKGVSSASSPPSSATVTPTQILEVTQ